MIQLILLISDEISVACGGARSISQRLLGERAAYPSLKAATVAEVIDAGQRSPFDRGPVEFRVLIDLTFETISDLQSSTVGIKAAIGLADDQALGLTVIKKVDRQAAAETSGPNPIKRVSLLRRNDATTAREFQHQWWGLHSELVKAMPGYVGYCQNLVVDRRIGDAAATHAEIPVDGIVEFWFPDISGFDDCYASEAFKKTAEHGAAFIKQITTYLVSSDILDL